MGNQDKPDLKSTDKIVLPPRRPAGFDWLKKLDANAKVVVEYEKKYEEFIQASKQFETESLSEYRKKILEPEEIPDFGKIEIKYLYESFKVAYKFFQKKDFDENANNQEGQYLAKTLLLYFTGNKAFLKSPMLSKINESSMSKGCLIMGSMGNGKTSIINTIYRMFSLPLSKPLYVKNTDGVFYPLSNWKIFFQYFDANGVVDDYEWRDNLQKAEFWTKHTSGMKIYDDVLTERMVSNYGKFEIFKDILEKRNKKRLKSIITCNYSSDENLKKQYPEKSRVELTLYEFGIRYGKRVYDRLHEDFNVIELKGKSLRK